MGIAAALAVSPVLSRSGIALAAKKLNSNFNGVQIGTITYSYRGMPGTAEDLLRYITQCGISSVELMGEPVEQYAGIPSRGSGRGPGGPGGQGGDRRREMTEEERKAMQQRQEEILDWRKTVSMDKFKELRKLYNDAGVNIHIVKFGNIGDGNMPGEAIDYYFNVAKALGAKGITRELSEEVAQKLAPFADKHQIIVGFHNHTQLKPATYDGPFLSYSKFLGINFDVGHYLAGTNESPIAFIEKYHERILSLHIKDRKLNNGPNMPFGQGDTPVKDILQLIKKEKWTFPADIELEYEIPPGSDAVTEVTKCVEYCKESLA